MNFFNFTFTLKKWINKNESKPFDSLSFQISRNPQTRLLKISTLNDIDIYTLTNLLNSDNPNQIFPFLYINLEPLRAFFYLQKPYKYLKLECQNKVTGKVPFFFHQITSNTWDMIFLPFNLFLQKTSFFKKMFPTIKFQLDLESSKFLIFLDNRKDKIMREFFVSFKNVFESKINYIKNSLLVEKMNSDEIVSLVDTLACYVLTRLNFLIVRIFVRFTSTSPGINSKKKIIKTSW